MRIIRRRRERVWNPLGFFLSLPPRLDVVLAPPMQERGEVAPSAQSSLAWTLNVFYTTRSPLPVICAMGAYVWVSLE